MRLWRVNRLCHRLSLQLKCMSRSFLPVLVGLCLGITVSIMYAPFSEDSCETYLARQDPQKMVKLRDTKSLDSAAEDEMYEPRQLEHPAEDFKLPDPKAGSKFYRPKFAATELGIREKLFVAVMSSKDTLNTLGVAINKTAAHYVTKMVFFIDQNPPSIPPGMVIVNFADNYNHLLPINVFKYIVKKYGHDYDYYLFLSDRAYVRAEKVFDLVSHISVSKHVHMGVPTGVSEDKAYCTLEGGVTLSQSLLSMVNASLKWCSDNCHHMDQSLNFGKCVVHVTGRECQSSVAGNQYSHHQVKDLNFYRDIPALKTQPDFNNSLTVFPMPDVRSHYQLHRYFCEVELNATYQHIQAMKENILDMSQYAPGGRDSISWPVGVPEPYKPKNRFDVIRWDYFTETHIFFQDDFTNVKELIGVDKLDIQDIIKASMEKLNQQHHNKFLYSKLINGYRRFDPQRGMEYILDLRLEDTSAPAGDPDDEDRDRASNKVVEKRVFLVRPLGEVEVVPMPYVTENNRINLVLPVRLSDVDRWSQFLDTYSKVQTEAPEELNLVIVYIYNRPLRQGEEDPFSVIKSVLIYYNDKTEGGTKFKSLSMITNGTYLSEFSIMDQVSSQLEDQALILMCSPGMQMNMEMLNRVRINTIAGWQVFFPIGFWQFKPNLIYDKKPYPTEIEFNSKTGHYDVLSYEHGSFYNSDYKEARKALDKQEVETYDVYEMFVKYSKLHVFRAVEPEFKHFYQQLDCPKTNPSTLQERCLERKSLNLATRAQLAKRIFDYQAKQEGHPNIVEGT